MVRAFASEKEVRFTIKEDYYAVVTPDKDKFEDSLRRQMSSLLRTNPANIRNMRIWPGSIEVAFELVAPTDLEAGQQEQAMEEFAELVASGKLQLTAADGNLPEENQYENVGNSGIGKREASCHLYTSAAADE